jgi:hypothetical protein
MQLVNDVRHAEVVIIYMLGIRRAILVDKRHAGHTEPFAGVFPQQELLLEGRAIEAPLTPHVVHLIERMQVMPGDQRMMQSYFQQLLDAIGSQLLLLRPTLPEVRRLSLAPHFAPVPMLALSDVWRGLLLDLEEHGGHAASAQARQILRDLYALEAMYPELRDEDEVKMLRDDAHAQEIYRPIQL